MGRLTTHVLDTATGRPAAGVHVALFRLEGSRAAVAEAVTNTDGRCDRPLMEGETMKAGRYELVFAVGAYLDRLGVVGAEPRFLDDVVIRFGIAAADQHYHVPLLVSPYGYATYRGS
ncbi:MAG: hydroxyisourate hydrolase [Hyphomicrobiaceae bacterium]